MTIEGMNIYGTDITMIGNKVDMEAAYSAINEAYLREEIPKGMVDQLTSWVTTLFEDFNASSITQKENSSFDSATNNLSATPEEEAAASATNGFDNVTRQAEIANKLIREANPEKQPEPESIFYTEKMSIDQESKA